MSSEYLPFISYFMKYRFGTEAPVMFFLSLLPPEDRCVILEGAMAFDPNNVDLFDKLALAYLKSGRADMSLSLLKYGVTAKHLSEEDSLIIGRKIETMQQAHKGSYGSSTNYEDSKAKFDQVIRELQANGEHLLFKEFCDMMDEFVTRRLGSEVPRTLAAPIPEWFDQFNLDCLSAKDVQSTQELARNYASISHPHIHHSLGIRFFHLGEFNAAKHHLTQATSLGVQNRKTFWKTIFAPGVGSSIVYLLSRELVARLPTHVNRFHLVINAYVFLSSAVDMIDNKAHDALAHRGRLVLSCKDEISQLLAPYRLDIPQEGLALSDCYRSSLGYLEMGLTKQAMTQRQTAERIHLWLSDTMVNGQQADRCSLENLAAIGQELHERIYSDLAVNFLHSYPVDLQMT